MKVTFNGENEVCNDVSILLSPNPKDIACFNFGSMFWLSKRPCIKRKKIRTMSSLRKQTTKRSGNINLCTAHWHLILERY